MALVELEPVAPGRAGERSKRDASPTSPRAGGGGESTPAAHYSSWAFLEEQITIGASGETLREEPARPAPADRLLAGVARLLRGLYGCVTRKKVVETNPPRVLARLENSVAPASPALPLALTPPAPIVILPSKTAQVESGARRLLARPGVRVWAPLALRGLAVLAGMLALAAIGASSIARGSGAAVPLPSGHAAGSFIAGGVGPLGGRTAGGNVAAASASAPPLASATPPSAPAPSGSAPVRDAGGALTADGKVILNRAGPDDLTRLPGVGRKRAEAIIALRQKLGGRFKRLTDLLRVKGIGTKGLKKMEPHLVLDAPA
jgi:competence protein ComEA